VNSDRASVALPWFRTTGRDGLFNLIKSVPATLKYEPGVIVADGTS
jgi:hypothetical protein